MTDSAELALTPQPAGEPAERTRTRVSVKLLIPATIVALVILTGLIGPLFIEYDPVTTHLKQRLLPPGATLPDGGTALLGTDHLGRDLLGQIIYGARTSVVVGVSVVIIAVLVGTTVGVLAGYFRGVVDLVVRRTVDITIALPSILLAILIAGVFAGSLWSIIIALSVSVWVGIARVSRATTLSIAERPWVDAARMLGVSSLTIIRRHVLPFVVGPVLALATVDFALAVIAEAGLSFLGIGLPTSTPSWGQTIANGRGYLASAWWISAFPGLALTIFVVSVGLLGDHLGHLYGRRFATA